MSMTTRLGYPWGLTRAVGPQPVRRTVCNERPDTMPSAYWRCGVRPGPRPDAASVQRRGFIRTSGDAGLVSQDAGALQRRGVRCQRRAEVANTHSATARTLIQRAMRSRATSLPKGQSMEADEDTYSAPRQAEIGPIPTRGGAGCGVPIWPASAGRRLACRAARVVWLSPTCLRVTHLPTGSQCILITCVLS